MERSGRRCFEDFLAKFGHCYRSIEMRAVCGKWNGGLRNIWTHLEFRPEPPGMIGLAGDLPDTDSLAALHAAFPDSEAPTLIDSIETGLLQVNGEQIVYLHGDNQNLGSGIPLRAYFYWERVSKGGESGQPWPWSCAELSGRGIRLLDCLRDLGEVRTQLRRLDPPYEDFADLLRDFGRYRKRPARVPERSGVAIEAPVLLRFAGHKCGRRRISVSIEASPPFSKMDPHIALIERLPDRPNKRASADLTGAVWQQKGELMVMDQDFSVVCGEDVVLALSIDDYQADELRLEEEGTTGLGPRDDSVQRPNAEHLRRVFVAHGRDEGAREAIARFLERLDFEPIILQEQPSKGQTVIEKFEENADVAFAVVLLTPDDVGYPRDRPEEAEPRARQNAILELGYFSARLERRCVCALLKGDIERPSDIAGIIYIKLDEEGAWKLKLAKELNAAGLEADLNKVL